MGSFNLVHHLLLMVIFGDFVSGCTNLQRQIFQLHPHVAALILARGGSKGIPLKNLQKVGQKTLLSRSLLEAREAGFDSIWVSTDHHLIAEEAAKFDNVNIHWRHPASATGEASSLSATQEFLLKHPYVDVVGLLQCTSPFLKKEYLIKVKKLLKEKFECVFSVSRSFKLLWRQESNKVFPVNFDPKSRPRRQDLGAQFSENGMFYFASRRMVINDRFQSERDLYETCSNNGEPIHKDIYRALLSQCNLDAAQFKTIWDLVGPSKCPQGIVNRTNFYKTLALVAWAHQGKTISEKLFDTFTGQEYPSPLIGDLTVIMSLKQKLFVQELPSISRSYHKLIEIDCVSVQLVPEKKGLFLKYSEYLVTSKRFACKVTRRYNDFVALHELLLNRFPYRLVPSLPPKKIIINDTQFLEERTRGLQRWLTLVCRHPVIYRDGIITFFLSDEGSDVQHRIRNAFRKAPDEFMTSDVAATAKELLPADNGQIAISRDNIRSLVNIVVRLKQDVESLVEQSHASSREIEDISAQLQNIGSINSHQFMENWDSVQKNFAGMSRELHGISKTNLIRADYEQRTVCEKLALLYDILVAHKELCERLEKGLANDHQVALSKMLALKKKKLQGAIRGIDAESVEQLEAKMLAQENIISSIDLRTDFSLYCVHLETQLVFAYLGTLPSILAGFVDLRTKTHFELLDLWRNLQSQYCIASSVNGVGKGT